LLLGHDSSVLKSEVWIPLNVYSDWLFIV
jgi:hypothetical protein